MLIVEEYENKNNFKNRLESTNNNVFLCNKVTIQKFNFNKLKYTHDEKNISDEITINNDENKIINNCEDINIDKNLDKNLDKNVYINIDKIINKIDTNINNKLHYYLKCIKKSRKKSYENNYEKINNNIKIKEPIHRKKKLINNANMRRLFNNKIS
jgi:hypothetical protein